MSDRTSRRGPSYVGYLLLGLLGLSLIAWAGMKALAFFGRRALKAAVATAPARPPLPSPNAFDDYAAAAQALRDDREIEGLLARQPDPIPASVLPAMEEALRKNARAQTRLRQGFAHEYRQPPPPPSMGPLKSEDRLFGRFRSLARLLALEGQVRAARGDWAGAASSYVDAVRLGEDLPRGGSMIQGLTGYSAAAIGRHRLWDDLDRSDAKTACALARRLEALSGLHVPYRETLAEERERKRDVIRDTLEYPDRYPAENRGSERLTREESRRFRQNAPLLYYQMLLADDAYLRAFHARGERPLTSDNPREFGLKGRMASDFFRTMAPTYDKGWAKERDDFTQIRLMAAALALGAYRKERSSLPERLDRLVPGYLREVPEDPFSPGHILEYGRQGDGYVLYSRGPDGDDDGGTPIDDPGKGRNGRSRARHYVNLDSQGDVVAGINP
jgi:hypothetical protein